MQDHGSEDKFGDTQFTSLRRHRRSRRSNQMLLGGLVLFLLVVGGVWYWLRVDSAFDPGTVGPPQTQPEVAGPEFDAPPPLDLPELEGSDAFVRGLVTRLSAHPQLAAWLVTDELVRRFVGVVVDLAGGSNPAGHLPVMAPDEEFRVQEQDGQFVIDPESYRRYDLLAATFASIDTEGAVRLYRQLRPLIDDAFEELGVPGRTFDETLRLAVVNILEADVIDRPLEVEPVEGVYEFRDPAIEDRRGGEKVFLRMGPENTRRIQGKARELARELGIEP